MSFSPAQIRMMADKGLTAYDIADLMDVRGNQDDAAVERRRAADRERKARERAKARLADVTPDTEGGCHAEVRTDRVSRKKDPIPQKKDSPLPSPPKGGSVSAPAGGSRNPETILGEVLPPDLVAEVIAHRKAMKAPVTVGAARGLAKAFSASGNPLAAAQAMMTNGWRGYNPEWAGANGARAGPARSALRTNNALDYFSEHEHDQPHDFQSESRNSAGGHVCINGELAFGEEPLSDGGRRDANGTASGSDLVDFRAWGVGDS